jgi:hypothetical protein
MDPDPESSKSLYRYCIDFCRFYLKQNFVLSIYSNQGPLNKGSYQYTLKTGDNDTYSFVGIDMCPRPGAGRPFNFLGHINKVFIFV